MISDFEKQKLKELFQKYAYKEGEVLFGNIIYQIKSEKEKSTPFFKFAFAYGLVCSAVLMLILMFLFINKPSRIEMMVNNTSKSIKLGESIETKNNKCEINLMDHGNVKVFENSSFKVITFSKNKVAIELLRGKSLFKVNKKEIAHFFVKTPNLKITVKGTEFFVNINEKNEEVHVIEGKIAIENLSNKLETYIKENEAIHFNLDKGSFIKEDTDIGRVNNIINPVLSDNKAKNKNIKKENIFMNINQNDRENLVYLDQKTLIFNKNFIYIYQTGDYSKFKKRVDVRVNIAKLSIYDSIILVNGEKGGLYAYSIDGDYLWGNEEAGVLKYFSKPVVKDGYIYIATVDKGIQIFSLEGRLVDVINRGDKKAIYNSPVVLDDRSIIYLNENGELIRYDPKSKADVWKINIDERMVFPYIIENGGVLYIVLKSAGEVVAIDVYSGNTIWSRSIKENMYINNFYMYGDYLILGSDESMLLFNRVTGEIEKVFNYDFSIKQAITETNRLYILSADNRVIIYNIPDFMKVYEKKFSKEIKRIAFFNGKLLAYGAYFSFEIKE